MNDRASSSGPALVRAAVAWVFLTSGVVKILFENPGALRFAKLGLPPSMALFVGLVEISCSLLVLGGLFTRLAAVPLAITMVVAIVTTKLPLLFGAGPEPIAAMPKIGFWAFAYQARLDLAMLIACGYLAAVGAGGWSLDAWRARRRSETTLLRTVHSTS